ncbi:MULTISPECIES: IclR family transcriptional regulator domain-containing protein [Chromohalobacter]|uniref:IclR family transcriptional regulator C-terminal domain-containing protein n=1 Tax=Chromohalobacter canadensis TaxID=141389 RepID=A0ABZ0YE46_9GAMM|nr:MULTISPECIES: IclR family transcriptional regulator C-terminal domain-containing protein [Chromohalobacter]MCK0769584.1 helix-turn-helix domain-containing protein [Chromohalobacter canadensis]WQH10364.1 IclR family transcriptional regulator C-terminal domain-containing protein [Chromohalobacter canadensis]
MASQDGALTPDDRDFVAALASGLEVIMAFDQANPRMTLSEVATKTQMNRAKARRFLLTLHALGYVRKQERYFELSPKALQLGYAFLSANNYHNAIQKYLEDVTLETGESSSLGVLDGKDVIYVARSAAKHRLMAITLAVGTRLPTIYTSMGRMLLSTLDIEERRRILSESDLVAHTSSSITDIHQLEEAIDTAGKQGYCIVDQELDSGLRSLAVPIFSGGGRLIGAMNVSTNSARVPLERLTDHILPCLQQKALEIKETLI